MSSSRIFTKDGKSVVARNASKGAMALSLLLFVSEAFLCHICMMPNVSFKMGEREVRGSTVRRPHHVKGFVRRSHLLVV